MGADQGETIIGIWDSRDQAKAVALERYLMQPCLIHQIRTEELYLRVRGLNFPGVVPGRRLLLDGPARQFTLDF